MHFLKRLSVISLLFSTTFCQHNYSQQKVPQVQSIEYEDFKALATQEQPLDLRPSKARQKALGGLYIPPPPVPSRKVLFGMKFEEAKKNVRILDVRSDEDFSRSNLSMDPDVKAPVIHIFWKKFFVKNEEVDLRIKKELEDKNISEKSIIVVLCNKGLSLQTVADVLHSMGYQRVLTFEGENKWQIHCE